MASIADIWRPYEREVRSIKKGTERKIILRKKHVNRRSEAVMKVNEVFREAAEKCKGKEGLEFQACIRDYMREHYEKKK